MARFRQFLVNELKVCNEAEAVNRVFFISAREMLDLRLKDRGVIRQGIFFGSSIQKKLRYMSQSENNAEPFY